MSSLPRCDSQVFQDGKTLMIVSTGPPGGNKNLEEWVRQLAAKLKSPTDWHYSGGRAQVLTLHPDLEAATELAMGFWVNETPKTTEGDPMTLLGWGVEGHSLYRAR